MVVEPELCVVGVPFAVTTEILQVEPDAPVETVPGQPVRGAVIV